MSDGQPLAQRLAARMQLGLLGTSNTIAHGVRVGRRVAQAMKDGGLVRRLPPRGTEPIRISAICTLGNRVEAYAGYLYLVVVVRRDVTIQAGQVAYGTEDAACEIDILPYGDVRQRIGLKQYAMMFRLLNRMIKEPDPPRLILVDHTLLLPKEFANSDDDDVQREYQEVANTAGAFWEEVRPLLSPWVNAGLTIVGLPQTKRMGEPLRSLAKGKAGALVDAVGTGIIQTALAPDRTIDEVGAPRIMATVLWPEQRSAAFAYSGLGLDPRTEPQILRKELDIVSFHYRSGLRTAPIQVEIPGGHKWNSEALDRLAGKLVEATPFDQPDAVPLPLWLGRQQFRNLSPKDILEQYQRATFQTLRSGELDKAWLQGWEPEGK